MATNKKPAKKVAPKITSKKTVTNTEEKDSTSELKIDNPKISVVPQGNQFLVTETSQDGGIYKSYISDTNPLEEETE